MGLDGVISDMIYLIDEENEPVMMQNSQEILDLNDKAVSCMLKNENETALRHLQEALARPCWKEIVDDEDYHLLPIRQRPPYYDDACPISSITVGSGLKDDGIFEFFNRALVIPRGCNFLLACPKKKRLCLAILLYNKGLLFHLEGIKTGDSKILSQALTCYGYAYYTIESPSRTYGFHDALLVVCSLFNNMGHIHSIQMNCEKTRQCLKWLQSIFAHKAAKRVLYPGQYSYFFRYISVDSSRQLLVAPTA